MTEKGIDAVLVTDLKNVFYLSGFTGTSAYLIIDRETSYIFTDFRYLQQAKEQCDGFEVVDIKDTEKCDGIYASYDLCGFEDSNISLSLFNKFRKKFKAVYPIGQMIYDIRKIKTEKEIILKTIRVVAELMDNPCSFRKFLENLGLESKDYEDLYKARGMYLTDIATLLEQQKDI